MSCRPALHLAGILFLIPALLPGTVSPPSGVAAEETVVHYLSGRGKDDAVPWEFFCTAGRRSGKWTALPVPSCWELHGFGTYNYGHDPERGTERGLYRLGFDVPGEWRGRNVDIVFDGVMTDAEVVVNGQPAGPVHQGGFFRFRYDVTGKLRFGGRNLLEVTANKMSSNPSVNFAERCADYWTFGGIFRPVWLEIRPAESIERMAIDARADGAMRIDVFLDGVREADGLEAQVQTLEGRPVGTPARVPVRPGQRVATLRTVVPDVRPWSAESPHLYRVELSLHAGAVLRHRARERLGFRTVELRPGDGIYLNGRKLRLQGVARHTFWPDSGRTTSEGVSRLDAGLIKEMNMNVVRTAHYPPDTHFLDACDELGIYVMDELPGWQAPPYDTAVGARLVREMVVRDVNHPSVLFWTNGNEGGRNPELDDHFARHDPQRRPVVAPYLNANHVAAPHYPSYEELERVLSGDTLFLSTEFLHGLYDGGAGAGLEDFWKQILGSPIAGGGLIWTFCDEGVRRTDLGGVLDTRGNLGADGILGPYREKEGSFFAIREIWSPVHVPMDSVTATFDGRVPVENRYQFTNLDQCAFRWKLVRFHPPGHPGGGHEGVATGKPRPPTIPPGGQGTLDLGLPPHWRQHDALFLTAADPHGRELYTWTWMIRSPAEVLRQVASTAVRTGRAHGRDDGQVLRLTAGQVEVTIAKASGKLVGVRSAGRTISLGNGPVLVGKNVAGWLQTLKHGPEGDAYTVRAEFGGNLRRLAWRLEPTGWLRLDYHFWLPNRDDHPDHDYYGVTFDYPEDRVRGVQWLGRGPYRVWKNRLRGVTFNVWEKAYNRGETGRIWEYPEFKGYYSDFHWGVIHSTEGEFVVATETPGMFLRLFTPSFEGALMATAAFPPGDLSFLHGIAPIGMKFIPAGGLGPQGRRHVAHGDFSGTLYFHFGE